MFRLSLLPLILLLTLSWTERVWAEPDGEACPALLDYEFRRLGDVQQERLCEAHRGKVILVVNTASQCGFTYQYAGLEHLYARFGGEGLVVIGFPSNDFGGQEPGSEAEVRQFCRNLYSISFPLYEKIRAARRGAHPFIQALAQQSGRYPGWNFHKYLIDRSGRVVGNWASGVEPESAAIVEAIRRHL